MALNSHSECDKFIGKCLHSVKLCVWTVHCFVMHFIRQHSVQLERVHTYTHTHISNSKMIQMCSNVSNKEQQSDMHNLSAVQMWSASELRARDLWLEPLTYPEVLQTYENNVM